MRRYKTAFPSVLIAAAACVFFSASCSRQTDGEDSASARGRAVSQQAKDVKKSPGEQLADLCGKGDFRGAAGLAGLVADPGARKKLLDKIRPSVSKSLDAALDAISKQPLTQPICCRFLFQIQKEKRLKARYRKDTAHCTTTAVLEKLLNFTIWRHQSSFPAPRPRNCYSLHTPIWARPRNLLRLRGNFINPTLILLRFKRFI